MCLWQWHPGNLHTTSAKIYKKNPQTLSEVIRLLEKLNAAQQLAAMLIPSTVSMMSNNDKCFVCGWMGHFGCHCPNAQCYSCDEFGHFVQDCPNKIPASGTPCHQDRSCSRHQYTYTWRDRSQSTHYVHRHGRHFKQSQSCCPSHCNRNSSSFRRHTSCSSSTHHSASCHPLANEHPHNHSYWDISNLHSYTPSCICHFCSRHHSCHYSMSQSWSFCSNSHCTAWETQPMVKAKPHPRPPIPPINTTIPRLSSSRSPCKILP